MAKKSKTFFSCVAVFYALVILLYDYTWVSGTDSMAEPGACPCHSEALAHPCPLYIRHSPSTKLLLAHLAPEHQHSNKRLTIMPSYIWEYNIIIYLNMRHGGSTGLAPPMAIRNTKTGQREGEKESHLPVFTSCISAQKGRSSLIGSSCIQLVHHKA